MKAKKIIKKVLFIFKRMGAGLSKEQMQKIYGGNETNNGGDKPSALVNCTIVHHPTVAEEQ